MRDHVQKKKSNHRLECAVIGLGQNGSTDKLVVEGGGLRYVAYGMQLQRAQSFTAHSVIYPYSPMGSF